MLIECVPNFSCNAAFAQAAAAMVEAAEGVGLLGWEHDVDHQRAVLTLAGPPEPLLRCVQGLIAKAVDELDLREHRGVHPRSGLADVVPFVPLRDATMADAVALAEALADWAAETLGLPGFLYEAAAREPGRRDLAHLRRALRKDEALAPDRPRADGAPRHPKAGVLITGARPLLVAFNLNLESEDLKLARRIARRIRASSGGLPGVKALGLRLASRGQVQVSMNLVDLSQSGPAEVFEAVEAACAEARVRVRGSELIGFLPRAAAVAALERRLASELPLAGRILEDRLAEVAPAPDFRASLERIASTAPAPGGGSAAAMAAALGAATLLKAARLSQGWPAEDEAALKALRERALALADEDERAFGALMAAYGWPRGDAAARARRKAEVARQRDAAYASSAGIIEVAEALCEVGGRLAEAGNPHLINDVALGVELAVAAARGGLWNGRANTAKGDAGAREALEARLAGLEAQREALRARLRG